MMKPLDTVRFHFDGHCSVHLGSSAKLSSQTTTRNPEHPVPDILLLLTHTERPGIGKLNTVCTCKHYASKILKSSKVCFGHRDKKKEPLVISKSLGPYFSSFLHPSVIADVKSTPVPTWLLADEMIVYWREKPVSCNLYIVRLHCMSNGWQHARTPIELRTSSSLWEKAETLGPVSSGIENAR